MFRIEAHSLWSFLGLISGEVTVSGVFSPTPSRSSSRRVCLTEFVLFVHSRLVSIVVLLTSRLLRFQNHQVFVETLPSVIAPSQPDGDYRAIVPRDGIS
jgi:hypothetical protein